jgi:hypothetical protein
MPAQNTGYLGYAVLVQYWADDNTPTGVVIPNDPNSPFYVPPTIDLITCPVSTPVPTPTPSPATPSYLKIQNNSSNLTPVVVFAKVVGASTFIITNLALNSSTEYTDAINYISQTGIVNGVLEISINLGNYAAGAFDFTVEKSIDAGLTYTDYLAGNVTIGDTGATHYVISTTTAPDRIANVSSYPLGTLLTINIDVTAAVPTVYRLRLQNQ